LNRLALPRCNLGRVQFVLGRQLGDRLLALIASRATLALNSAENRLRVLMVIRPLYRRIHPTGLSQEAGPPLPSRLMLRSRMLDQRSCPTMALSITRENLRGDVVGKQAAS